MTMPDPFEVRIATTDPIPIVVLSGEFDLAVSEQAWKTMEPVVTARGTGLVLDLSAVTFIDSRGLSVLARVLQTLDGSVLTIRGASERLVQLLEVSGLVDLVTME